MHIGAMKSIVQVVIVFAGEARVKRFRK